jgi:hypothetical protein
LKPKKTHDRASKRFMTGAEAAEQAANKAEKTAAQPPQQDKSNGDNNIIGESQGGTTITLALRTPERLQRSHNLISSTPSEASDTSEASDSPESQAQPPASTAPARIEGEEPRKRRRLQNKLYRESQYEL